MTGGQDMLREALGELLENADPDVSDTAIIVGNGASAMLRKLRDALSAQRDTSGAVGSDRLREALRLIGMNNAPAEAMAELARTALLYTPAAASVGEGMREALVEARDWDEKIAELYQWTGSDWLSGTGAGHEEWRYQHYRWLCRLAGYLMAGKEAALKALAREAAGVDGGASVVVPRELLEPFLRFAADIGNAVEDEMILAATKVHSGERLTYGNFRALLAAAPIAQPAEEEA